MKGCSISLELLFQAKSLLARNLTLYTYGAYTCFRTRWRAALADLRSLSHVILDHVLPVLDVNCVILCKLFV